MILEYIRILLTKGPSPHFSMLYNMKLFQLGHFFTLEQHWNWVKAGNLENIQKFQYIFSKVVWFGKMGREFEMKTLFEL